MLARAASASPLGIGAEPVVVEAYRGRGLPGLTVVGLARGAVREASVRVRAALLAVGCSLGSLRLVASLLPAELPKETSGLDVPLALALMVAAGKLPADALAGRRFFGELSLGGAMEPVRGVILVAELARRGGDRELCVPAANAAEAAVVPGLRAVAAASLAELIGHLDGRAPLAKVGSSRPPAGPAQAAGGGPCLSQVAGQAAAKRALEVAAAGGHNLLLVGPPGAGKSFLARRLVGLLPPLTADERIEVTRIQAVAGGSVAALVQDPPFRAPHHTASGVALCGGGSPPRPGEVTLAHRGVLFLDELAEFPRRSLDSLREPLEEGHIDVARASGSLRFPARAMLVAATNPCPCGHFAPGAAGRCICSMEQVERYRARLSGPFLDRIDMQVGMQPAPLVDLMAGGGGEASAAVRRRVEAARGRQLARQGQLNASLPWAAAWGRMGGGRGQVAARLQEVERRHGLSTRGILRVLKLAATITDLLGGDRVGIDAVEEALALRLAGAW